jgi:hypothetical protein
MCLEPMALKGAPNKAAFERSLAIMLSQHHTLAVFVVLPFAREYELVKLVEDLHGSTRYCERVEIRPAGTC